MYHSVYFGDKNSWDDYGLVPINKIYIPEPSQKTNYVEVEGASGSLDFSTLITGYPIYNNITGEMQFYLLDRYDARVIANNGYAYPENYTFYDIFSKIRAELNGKQFKVWLEDDPDWYYFGRIAVKATMTSPRPSVVISYNFEPYKKTRTPKTYILNGMGSIINRQIIPYEILGPMPTNFKMKVTGGEMQVGFVCDSLGISESKTLQIGEHLIYEWVAYEEATVMVSAPATTSLTLSFEYGRL